MQYGRPGIQNVVRRPRGLVGTLTIEVVSELVDVTCMTGPHTSSLTKLRRSLVKGPHLLKHTEGKC